MNGTAFRRSSPARAARRALLVNALGAFGIMTCSAACEGGAPTTGPAEDAIGMTQAASNSRIVARRGASEISLADIEQPVQLQLHDLAVQQFRLRRRSLLTSSLRALEQAVDGAPVVHLSLEPPAPPRLPAVEPDADRMRPAAEAPVTVLAFCNFESPHCVRLQVTLAGLLPLYSGVVRFAERDLPLPFHPNAARAAEAARCALEQNRYWAFHDVLYAGSGPPDAERIERAARTALLDSVAFNECLSRGRWASAVASDAALAARLGIASVPAVFVNGLYASSPVEPGDLIWLIELELARLGVTSPRMDAMASPTAAALALHATLPSDQAGQGFAVLSESDGDGMQVVAEGAEISSSLLVEGVNEHGIWLRNGGVREWLSLDPSPSQAEEIGTEASGRLSSEDDDLPIVTPHRALPLALDRDEVLVRLADRLGLESALVPVPMTSGGYRQMRISAVQAGSLYELLGLMPGDVILGVNEQPVHEADNPLWRALESEKEVRVRVMRRGGVAHHYTYRFED